MHPITQVDTPHIEDYMYDQAEIIGSDNLKFMRRTAKPFKHRTHKKECVRVEVHQAPDRTAITTKYIGHKRFANKNEVPKWNGTTSDFNMQARAKIKRAANYIQKTTESRSIYIRGNQHKGVFVTLTFKERNIDHKESKKALNSWLTYLRRLKPNIKYIWTAELQKDGTIHFHLIINNYLPKKVLKAWYKNYGRIDCQRIKWACAAYIAKYMRKGNNVIEGFRYGISRNLQAELNTGRKEWYDFDIEYCQEILDYFHSYQPIEYGMTKKILIPPDCDYYYIIEGLIEKWCYQKSHTMGLTNEIF